MEVAIDKNGEILTFFVSGRLDTSTAPKLEADLNAQLTDDIRKVVFDFDKLEYISSAGLRIVIIAVHKLKGKGEVRVANLNDEVREVFEITGLLNVLEAD